MTFIIGSVGQKGGVGKSTIARMVAREAAAGGLSVKIADLDHKQQTCTRWNARRASAGHEPELRVESFQNPKTALAEADQFDVYIIDGAPHSSRDTAVVAQHANLIVIPTSESLEDLEPSVLLAHDLRKDGVPIERIVFALCKVLDSDREIEGARAYLEKTPYKVLDGEVPERVGFRKAIEQGRTITETPFKTLTARADRLAQNIIDAVVAAGDRRAA